MTRAPQWFETFLNRLRGPSSGSNSAILSEILSQARPDASLGELQEWTEKLLDWVVRDRATLMETLDAERAKVARLKLILQFLKQRPELSARVRQTLRAAIQTTPSLNLFCETGIPREPAFFSETIRRIAKRILPEPPSERDWADILGDVLETSGESDWTLRLPEELVRELREYVEERDPQALSPVRQAMLDAILILSAQVYGIGVQPDLRRRSPDLPIRALPEFRLAQRCESFSQRRRGHGPLDPSVLVSAAEVFTEVQSCRDRIQGIYDHLESFGVSVDLVYQLERMSSCLARIETLVSLLAPRTETGLPENADTLALLIHLAREATEDRSLRSLVGNNLRFLSRKIVQRAGDTGEHYIARNAREYWALLAQAAGGGVLTAGTALMKFFLGKFKVAPLFEAVFASFNYAGSFLVMQALGFKLATKQPAMTAAALSAKIEDRQIEFSGFAEEVALITRSQFAAVLGNIGAVIPAALALEFTHRWWFGGSLLDQKTALYAITSLDPFTTMTLLYAALTGVLLWASSVGSGWIENAFVYHRLGEAMANHPTMIRRFGRARATRWAEAISHQISGIASNTLLGVLLGFTPVIGKFLGLPIDVRHVTLSTASYVFAGATLWDDPQILSYLYFGFIGIFFIGLLNFTVSFALAMIVALRARNVDRMRFLAIARSVGRKLLEEPVHFLFPRRRMSAGTPPPMPPGANSRSELH